MENCIDLSALRIFGAAMNEEQALGRTERRYLRRVFNGRQTPFTTGNHEFLTFKDASRYLLSLGAEDRAAAYQEMRGQAEAEAADKSASLPDEASD
jgi:aspartate aminotransferase-like enzyme